MKYIKKFENHDNYELFITSGDYPKPNVSYCVDKNEVHYNPYVPPMNVITYEATEKLVETTSTKSSGLHTNAFSGSSGELEITSHTFENGVGTIEFNGDVINIGGLAFQSCSSLTSVEIPNSVTSIGGFLGCSSLTRLNSDIDGEAYIPRSVTSIGSNAFDRCSKLTNIDIPNSVTNIGVSAFSETPWWNTYSADTSHHYGNIIYINDVAHNAVSTAIISCTFKEGTVSISYGAFQNCTNLTSVIIPSSVTSIDNYTFANCTSLTSVEIPNSVTSIGNSAFVQCSGLTSVTIPNSVTSIGQYAFDECSGLTSVTVNAVTPPALGDYVFHSTNNCPIYVPSASVETYKAANNWSTYASRIQAIP